MSKLENYYGKFVKIKDSYQDMAKLNIQQA